MDARLHEHISQALAANRPLLHHLNADSSWLLQIPRPNPQAGETAWYNILIDPWLSGSQSDIAPWFSTQRHAEVCAVSSIAGVESLLRDIEAQTRASNPDASAQSPAANADSQQSMINVIAISHEFTDHCHKQTLLQCDPATPIVAPRKAARIIRSWKHFTAVDETASFPPSGSKDWRDAPASSFPPWLRIARLTSAFDLQYFHSALIILFECGNVESGEDAGRHAAEAVIYTPHGYQARDLPFVHEMFPRVRPLALLHGLHNVTMPAKQINYGAFNGLEAQRILRATYWVRTHDEIKIPAGIIKYLLRRKAYGISDVLVHESAKKRSAGHSEEEDKGEVMDDTSFVDLGNGQSLVLR